MGVVHRVVISLFSTFVFGWDMELLEWRGLRKKKIPYTTSTAWHASLWRCFSRGVRSVLRTFSASGVAVTHDDALLLSSLRRFVHKAHETDSTIAPLPKPAVFFNERFINHHGCSTQGRAQLKTKYPCISLCAKGLSIDDVGVSRDTVCQEIRPGTGFKTADFVEEKLGELPWNDSSMNDG